MYLAISFIILIVSIYLFGRVIGSYSILKLNMVSWALYYQLILQSFIASVLVITGIDDHYAINRVGMESKFNGWLSVQYTMVGVPIGMMLALYLFGLKRNNIVFEGYIRAPIVNQFKYDEYSFKIVLKALSIISVFAVIYTFYELRGIPLLTALKGGDSQALLGLRQQAAREFQGNTYVRNILALSLSPVLSYVWFAYYKLSKSMGDFLWFFGALVSSFFILTYDLSKSPFVFYLLGFMFLGVYINAGVSKRTISYFGTGAFVLIIGAYYLVADVVDISELLSIRSGIGGRVLLSQSAGTYFSFEYFPRVNDHLGWSSISSFVANGLGLEPSERSARILMGIFNPAAMEAGEAGVMNSLFIGEAWANFGIAGVLIAPFYVGFVTQIIFLAFIKSKKTPLMLGFFVYFTLNLPITGGFNDFVYNAGWFINLLIFIFLIVAARILRLVKP